MNDNCIMGQYKEFLRRWAVGKQTNCLLRKTYCSFIIFCRSSIFVDFVVDFIHEFKCSTKCYNYLYMLNIKHSSMNSNILESKHLCLNRSTYWKPWNSMTGNINETKVTIFSKASQENTALPHPSHCVVLLLLLAGLHQ